ncbi:hypothetical protein BFJ72_g8298 [Fusarium proliferatum]|uniref:Uncharacterized protein n=1 Tax=Gibberella intermedia TaxID=948311 RepID=A0A420T5F1_GIBIN|nr:hypothetical protein BFJ72_g8298 [Fusarium proliferatum]
MPDSSCVSDFHCALLSRDALPTEISPLIIDACEIGWKFCPGRAKSGPTG